MSRASTSLDLSEFFSNDDSDGHRLAEFLQKRRGGVQRPDFLFLNCEPQRLSLNVQLEKLPPSQQAVNSLEINAQQQENAGGNDINEVTISKDLQEASVEDKIAVLHGDTVEVASNNLPDNEIPAVAPSVQNALKDSVSPISPFRHQSLLATQSPSHLPIALEPLSPRPLSPILASIRKSGGGVSPSDRLRRYSLKRLTKMCAGRRTLLQEFESTAVSETNFDPPVCSTPLSQPPTDKTGVTPATSPPADTENCEPNAVNTEKNSTVNESCCSHTDTLLRTLQHKDEELKNYMESLFKNTSKKIQEKESNSATNVTKTNATKSPLKRTYTVEKGDIPGQVILTPDKSPTGDSPQNSKLLRSIIQPSTSQILKTPERNRNRSMISIRVESPQNLSTRQLNNTLSPKGSRPNQKESGTNVSRYLSQQQQKSRQTMKAAVSEVPNTPPSPSNISIIFPTQDVEIPETQEQLPTRENTLIIHSDNQEIPVVVIPVSQTFNRTYDGEHYLNNNTIITARTKHSKNGNAEQETKQTTETREELAEDTLKLTDILTDDEEETPKAAMSRTIENNSQAPLNLAPSATNGRIKRLRKRSISRRRLQMDNTQLLSTETETELPPQAHTSRRMVKRKHIPLNRAPGTPLNGEKFAQELARMSNYEILDLRKRNSMGRVFAISGGRSVRLHEDAVKKQHELDDQIKMELIKRNIEQETDKHRVQTNTSNVDEDPEDAYPPVPDEFRDSFSKQIRNYSRESSLIDEKSSDRISFKNKRNSLKQSQRQLKCKQKTIPEVLKQYLEVSKKLSQKKKVKNSSNISKRSLYTQGYSDSEETNSSPDKNTLEKTYRLVGSRNKKQSLPCVPSPPKSDVDQITTLKVVSPPPPLSITPSKSLKQQQKQSTVGDGTEENSIEAQLPPPPPGFESDSGVSSNNFNLHSNTTVNNTIQRTDKVANNNNNTITSTTIYLNTTITNSKNIDTNANDEQIFKKPQKPAPRRNARKAKVSKTPSNESQESTDSCSSADTTDGSSLRRSRRCQVSTKHPVPIFQLLFQQSLNRRLEMMEKRQQKEKQKLREATKANKTSLTNNNSIQTESSQKPSKTGKSSRQCKKLPSVPEDETLIASLQQDVEILQSKKKAPKIKESKVKRKYNKKKQEQIKTIDNFECSRIILNTPPPVEHLNIVFDQLRNSSSTHITSGAVDQPVSVPPPAAVTAPSRDLMKKVKPFRVRVARLKSAAKPSDSDSERATYSYTKTNSTISTTTSSIMSSNMNSNYELISWLKNISESDSSVACNEKIFKEMRISAASNLSFTELQGIEYAFYDTDEKASLGYLRFKPRQIKPKKKAKRFHLHFVTLVGNFRVTANDKVSQIGVGDMVAIEKSVYYDIENITDDIGILMVIKK